MDKNLSENPTSCRVFLVRRMTAIGRKGGAPTRRELIKAQQYRRRARYRRNPKQLQIIKNNRLVWYYDKTLHGDALKTEL